MNNINTLQNLGNIPAFNSLKAQDIAPAMNQAINQAREKILAIKKNQNYTWKNTIDVLTDIHEQVGRIWGVIAHIHSVADTPEWRKEYNNLIEPVSQFFTEISQDNDLFEYFKKIKNSSEFPTLSPAQQKKLNNDLRDFILSGADLPRDKQQRLAELNTKRAKLSASFSQNLLDATDAFSLYFDNTELLSGLPETALSMFKDYAQEHNQTGYRIGLQSPHYLAIMQFADNRSLREQIYRSYTSRASELDDIKRDNTPIIDQILATTREEAKLLGFHNYAELSLATKMADSPDQVIEFLTDIAHRAKPFAQKDLAELQTFAQEVYQQDNLQPWDIAYYSEKLREQRYLFSEEEVRQYFPASKVLTGLFSLINELYQVDFIEEKRPVWHDSVRYFSLRKNHQDIGGVYIDLYARQGKKSGAWMNEYCSRHRLSDGTLQLPIAYLVCNFTPPNQGESYLSHQEILTLFHEMGHGLHHLLTRIEEADVSGINGVEWDAVELPSQFMENFAQEYDVLVSLSAHKEDGSPLPKDLFDKITASKNFQTGLFLVRQLEFGLFDLTIYKQDTEPYNWQKILQNIRQQVAVIPSIPENRFANSFSHIFAGGYSAGYYSYLWAEVLSADVYSAFMEEKNRTQTGQRFWQEILSVGGSRPASESFRAFRGRNPNPDALFKQLGLITSS